MSLNLSTLFAKINTVEGGIKNSIEKLGTTTKDKDGIETTTIDQKDLLNMQLQVSTYQNMVGLTTAIASDVKQAAQGIIQKV
jgi:hypothetical protein